MQYGRKLPYTDAAWALKMAIYAVGQEAATYFSLANMPYVKLK